MIRITLRQSLVRIMVILFQRIILTLDMGQDKHMLKDADQKVLKYYLFVIMQSNNQNYYYALFNGKIIYYKLIIFRYSNLFFYFDL